MNFLVEDVRRLTAAEGWLDLGDWQSATKELDQIAPNLLGQSRVLKLYYRIYSASNDWERAFGAAEALVKLLPHDADSWILRSFALHELGRAKEALAKLLPAIVLFPEHWLVSYNLACYACQLGQLDDARHFLERACRLGDGKKVKEMALHDPDLSQLNEGKTG